jgi:predicted nucleic acid-binding protein
MDYFFDSSGLIKRYITEIGTTWVRSIVPLSAGHRIYIAQITSIEMVSAISRRRREGTLTPREANIIRRLLHRHIQREYKLHLLTEEIITMAENLLEKHPLRAGDAIQLATSLKINAGLLSLSLPPLTFVSSDKRLLSIASTEALPTHEPL